MNDPVYRRMTIGARAVGLLSAMITVDGMITSPPLHDMAREIVADWEELELLRKAREANEAGLRG